MSLLFEASLAAVLSLTPVLNLFGRDNTRSEVVPDDCGSYPMYLFDFFKYYFYMKQYWVFFTPFYVLKAFS